MPEYTSTSRGRAYPLELDVTYGSDDFIHPDASGSEDDYSFYQTQTRQNGKFSKLMALTFTAAAIVGGGVYAMRSSRNNSNLLSTAPPSKTPTLAPTLSPTVSTSPTVSPTQTPQPTQAPSQSPSQSPSYSPSMSPTIQLPFELPRDQSNEPALPSFNLTQFDLGEWSSLGLLNSQRTIFSEGESSEGGSNKSTNLLDYTVAGTNDLNEAFVQNVEDQAIECLMNSEKPWVMMNAQPQLDKDTGGVVYLHGRPGLAKVFSQGDDAEFIATLRKASLGDSQLQETFRTFNQQGLDQCSEEDSSSINIHGASALRIMNTEGQTADIGVQSNCGSTQEMMLSLLKMLRISNSQFEVHSNIQPWWNGQSLSEPVAYQYLPFLAIKASSQDTNSSIACLSEQLQEHKDLLVRTEEKKVDQPDPAEKKQQPAPAPSSSGATDQSDQDGSGGVFLLLIAAAVCLLGCSHSERQTNR